MIHIEVIKFEIELCLKEINRLTQKKSVVLYLNCIDRIKDLRKKLNNLK